MVLPKMNTEAAKSTFRFSVGTQVSLGAGCRKELGPIVTQNQWKRLGFVVDHNLSANEGVMKLITEIRTLCDHTVVGWCEVSEPTYDALELARKSFADQELQVIVGIGGGSALDMAKAMAVLVQNKRPAIEYRGFDRMTEPVLPVVAIPTTAGTGSEVTPNASFVDSREKRKMGINGEAVRPRYAFLDPELTLTCPRAPTISAGVDSLVHATEAYVAKKTNPLARLFAREGFARVFNALPRVVNAPNDVALRGEVMFGAFLSGVALMHSGTGPAAAMSYPLGVHYGVPHGIGGAIFLPHVARYNVQQGVLDYADLYLAMDGANPSSSREMQALGFADRMIEEWKRLGVPSHLGACGLSLEKIEPFVHETAQLQAALDQNPAPFGSAEIRATLRHLLGPL
jgi:alcohol dehydrogenase class IV